MQKYDKICIIKIQKGIIMKNIKNDLLIIVDMQNVYLPNMPWACKKSPIAAENIIKLIESGTIQNIVFTTFMPPKNPVGRWKQYNEEYSDINNDPYMSELMDCLKPYAEHYPVYEKSVYSSYAIPELTELSANADRVLITGVVAECCVLATAISAIDAGAKVCYIKDAVAGFSEQTEVETEHIISYLSPLHTEVLKTDEYLDK